MDYPKQNEGKLIDKYTFRIYAKVPDYKSVVPNLADYRKIENPKMDFRNPAEMNFLTRMWYMIMR